mmetsp:Transcript_372/g.678  ORF Transcript_372/g.678 Transcript_372/m.678 type:complete len:208 (+) Transcript_372:764-1387(+)
MFFTSTYWRFKFVYIRLLLHRLLSVLVLCLSFCFVIILVILTLLFCTVVFSFVCFSRCLLFRHVSQVRWHMLLLCKLLFLFKISHGVFVHVRPSSHDSAYCRPRYADLLITVKAKNIVINIDHIIGNDLDNSAFREHSHQRAYGFQIIVWKSVRRDEDAAIGDIKTHVSTIELINRGTKFLFQLLQLFFGLPGRNHNPPSVHKTPPI